VVKHFPSIYRALSLIHSTKKEKKERKRRREVGSPEISKKGNSPPQYTTDSYHASLLIVICRNEVVRGK
jgi:hypothetical protein